MNEECIPNIGAGQRRKRLLMGVVGVVLALVVDIALVVAGGPRPARVLVALPLTVGVYGFLQAFAKT